MLYSDAGLGLQATAVVLADGAVCSEHNPTRPGVCSIGVRAGQRLSINISFTGSCPIVFVDIIIDGVYRRLKYYTKNPAVPNPGPPLTDTIRSVWCREGWGLGWSYMTVANITAKHSASLTASRAFSANIGSIEVQFSIPDANGCERGRTGRSFEDDHVGKPLVARGGAGVSRTPTHRIHIFKMENLTPETQAEARQSMQTKRPGALPWASFCFNYRDQRSFPTTSVTPCPPPLTASWRISRDEALPFRPLEPAPSTVHMISSAVPSSVQLVRPTASLHSNKRCRSPTLDPRKRARQSRDDWTDITDEEYSSRLTIIGHTSCSSLATTSEQVDLFVMETMKEHFKPLPSPTSPPLGHHPLRAKEESRVVPVNACHHSTVVDIGVKDEQKFIPDDVEGVTGVPKFTKNGGNKKLWEGMEGNNLSLKRQKEELETRREAIGMRLGFR